MTLLPNNEILKLLSRLSWHFPCLLPPASCLLLLPGLLQNPHCRVAARRSHDSTARVGRGAAHVKVPNRRPVLRPSRSRAQEEELFERELPLEDVSFRQSPLT